MSSIEAAARFGGPEKGIEIVAELAECGHPVTAAEPYWLSEIVVESEANSTDVVPDGWYCGECEVRLSALDADPALEDEIARREGWLL